jgi:hypothetical protein
MTTTRKHPREMNDGDIAELVAELDDAVENGDVRVVGETALRELRSAAAFRRSADDRVEAAVRAARRAGASWGVIGAQLGVTRQGARQKYELLVSVVKD